MDLNGKICLVTGAARGIGAAIVRTLAGKGATVYAADLDVTAFQEQFTATACGEIRCAACDVTVEEAVTGLFERIRAESGGLDVLVNNAGIVRDGLLIKQKNEVVQKMALADFRAVLEVNLTGTFLCAREAAALMLKTGGVIINISSVSRAGNFGQTNYSASKAGIDAMTVVWSKELARYNIRVAAVAPGYTKTEMVASMRPEVLEKITAQVPLKRLGEMDEIVAAVEFIINNDFFSGKVLEVDGGLRI